MDSNSIDLNKSIDYSSIGIHHEHTQFETYKHDSWQFSHSNRRMFASKDLDLIEPTMKVKKLPDMFYGYNRLLIFNKELDFLLDFNAIDMLNYASYEVRNECLNKTAINFASTETNIEKVDFSSAIPSENVRGVYYIPGELKVQFADKWKLVKVDRDDIEKRDPVMDWTFSTPYMGTISNLSESKMCSNKEQPTEKRTFTIVPSKEEIPLNRLGPENPIQHYCDVRFFDDELCDNGHCTGNIRFRVMKDSFFGLLRDYIRVDNVMVRVIDTRIYHSFGDDYILRDFQVRECTYKTLKEKGFDVNSEWSLAQNQSDLVYKSLDVVFATRDKILLDVKK